jgi:prepilin-type N-terminal cleavage/methylation domain-containing protein
MVFRIDVSLDKAKGFTLIELAISLGILSIITAGGIYLYMTVIQSANRATSAGEVENTASLLMETMVREIRAAQCVSVETDEKLNILNARCEGPALVVFERSCSGGDCDLNRNDASLNPDTVTVSSLSFVPVPAATPSPDNYDIKAVQIALTVEMRDPPRSDYDASISLNETVTIRSY